MKKNGWGFDMRDMDKKARPQDDFYQYACGGWLKRNKIPPMESRWGTFYILRYETEKKLRSLFDDLARTKRLSDDSPERTIRDFYRSGLNLKARTKLGTKPIAEYLDRISAVKNIDDLISCLAELHVIGVDAMFGSGVDQDLKNNDTNILWLSQGGLGMPDRDYYLNDDPELKRVRDAYRPHIAKMFRLAFPKMKKSEAIQAANTIFAIERQLAEASMTKEDCREVEKTYNKMPVGTLAQKTPNINWQKYFKQIGARLTWKSDIHGCRGCRTSTKCSVVVMMQPDFFANVSQMIVDVPLADWRTYLIFHLVSGASGVLSPKLLRQNFAFYGTVLAGVTIMKPLWRQVLAVVNGSVDEIVGRAYVAKYFTPATKKKTNEMVDDLVAAYEARIKCLDWMSPATKKKALAKLRVMVRKIGYPDRWQSYRGLVIKPDDYAGNALRAAHYEHIRQMKKLGKKTDRKEWFMSPQTVNAYCNPSMNEIVFPAAILQPPCFDPLADDAINYGSMGAIIGHEMIHNFDDQGAKFDEKGRLKNWWTPADATKFKNKSNPLIAQFNGYTVADGVHVNGQPTLGENVADLAGLAIAYDAYQRRLEKTGRKNIDGLTPEQRFFLGFTIFDRELARPEIEKTLALTDPHSPSRYRINGPVSNMRVFYDAFGVIKGDALYRSPASRVHVW